MEDRLTPPQRPGMAALALLLILVITAGWWALALWPLGAVEPEWLVRTRAACFGSSPGGLPDAGGWVLLIGEPIGMIGFLIAAWGTALREDLRRVRASTGWRAFALGVLALSALGVGAAGRQVAYATGLTGVEPIVNGGGPVATRVDAGAIRLIDQFGTKGPITPAGAPHALLTFAFGHCATICPAIVHDLIAARRAAGRDALPIVVISVDPWRDTPLRLPGIAATWQLAPHDRVLSGTVAEVQEVLELLGIGHQRDTTTGDVEHAAAVMVIDSMGIVTHRLDGTWGRLGDLLATLPTLPQ